MRPDARAWFEHRTTTATSMAEIDVEALLLAKRRGGHRVSVVLPARNEEATVGTLVADLADRWVHGTPLVDELLVIDSDSTDRTAEVARAAGADVVATVDVLPGHGNRPGKGEALWKSLAATSGDIVVFLDSDLLGEVGHYVPGLLTPLLLDPRVDYVKGCYTRPLHVDGVARPAGGGRVTELTARPLLNALWPELAGFVQPLGGEYAGRRSVLEQVPFVSGYGVEIGLLVDLLQECGLAGLAQVDLGVRRHSHQTDEALGRMAGQIVSTVLARAERGRTGRRRLDPGGLLTQFSNDGTGFIPVSHAVSVDERPPMIAVAEYAVARGEVVEQA
ncbi:glucosyl-3-phosphoglycerate synthase [Modestobacter sp. I12A-02628]|uniref:Glucosyl-3-phosphoglycerate synthase n=1 Tax=Goekera deserti TaxID=2497753 RepID=A0A7K3WHV2_9ACTN|nr:glucosyl-3-phosphoglycerate synthase [Goekera deserti]MPQ97882.1 glucosyl-3-phosphoglycerate synthase [Goekera deserti]NDI48528.1 glucosyl-3-phosphoglycerate synthase [Goekera deserti]NEL55093.1 glucosyl-3-phosphoglycerate synthase [Goekera deserti]